MHDGRIKIAVTAPPVDGEANAAVIDLLGHRLGIARGDIAVVAGASCRARGRPRHRRGSNATHSLPRSGTSRTE
jgi:hypothetical protein